MRPLLILSSVSLIAALSGCAVAPDIEALIACENYQRDEGLPAFDEAGFDIVAQPLNESVYHVSGTALIIHDEAAYTYAVECEVAVEDDVVVTTSSSTEISR